MSINKDEFIGFLEDYLMEEEAKELEIKIAETEEQSGPLIDSMQKANYFLKLVSKIQEDIDSINMLCDGEIEKTIERVNAYRNSQIKPLANQKEYYANLLKNFAEKELEDSKKRSVKLPYGTLSIKKQQPKWDYGDEAELLQWLKTNELQCVINEKISHSIDKKSLKDQVIVTPDNIVMLNGKVLPGIQVIEQADKFTIKI